MDTKICTKCNYDKPVDEFRWRNKAKGLRSSWCKSCYSIHEKKKWRTGDRKNIHRQQRGARRNRNLQYIWGYLKQHHCATCGETDSVVLEFDHIEPDTKEKSISDLAKGYSLDKIQKEIDKCQVLCANCHRRKTAAERGWDKAVT